MEIDEFVLEHNSETINISQETVNLNADEENPSINITEEQPVSISTEEEEVIEIQMNTAFSPVGGTNDELNHAKLENRNIPNQHIIDSITGLRDELNQIESLKTVYSNKFGHGNYFLWEDGNNGRENRIGFFVSLCSEENEIKIYDGSNILGVTVEDAAFVGGQDVLSRDYRYGLVACSGDVLVRCEADVSVGDCVIPNRWGIAEKSDKYGYKVVAIDDNDGISTFAKIILDMSSDQMDTLSKDVIALEDSVAQTINNVTSAINVANAAISKVNELEVSCGSSAGDAAEALQKATTALNTAQSFDDRISTINASAVQAREEANTAVAAIQVMHNEAVAEANSALENVNNLIENLEPIVQWQGIDEDGNPQTGAKYFVDYINNQGIYTENEIQTLTTLTEENKSLIEKSAKNFHMLVSSVDTYSLGYYSQSYGLSSREQATSILTENSVYVPYDPEDSLGNYEYRESFLEEDDTYLFVQGHHYTWKIDNDDKGYWEDSATDTVAFSTEYTEHTGNISYWVPRNDVIDDGVTYEKDCLYKWDNNQWIKVAALIDNVNNRLISSLRQDVDAIAAEIVNTSGSYSSIKEALENESSNIDLITEWQGNVDSGLASISLTATDAYASVSQIVSNIGSNGEVNVASIVTAINNDESSVSILADKINLNGAITANDNVHISQNGRIIAQNATIIGHISATSGWIGDNSGSDGFKIAYNGAYVYTVGSNGLPAGSYDFCIDGRYYTFTLEDKLYNGDKITYYGSNLSVNSDPLSYNNANLNSENQVLKFESQSGGHYYLCNNQGAYNGIYGPYVTPSFAQGVYIGPDGIGLGNGRFFVDRYGNITMGGNITWNANSNPLKVLYAAENFGTPTGNYNSFDDEDNWHPTFKSTDYFASYSYSNGVNGSWSTPVQIRGINGRNGADGDDAELSDDALFDLLTEDGSKVGIFNAGTENGEDKLFINANYIKSGTVVADFISLYGIEVKKKILGEETDEITFKVDDTGNVWAPTLYSNDFNIISTDTNGKGGLYLFNNQWDASVLEIYYYENILGAPRIAFSSELNGVYVDWNFSRTNFYGNIDFSGCESITGLSSSTAVFG